jgi:hypothetical protein
VGQKPDRVSEPSTVFTKLPITGSLGAEWREPQIRRKQFSISSGRTEGSDVSRRSINVQMISGKGHSSGGVRVFADPQAGVMATGNHPTAWLAMRSPLCPRLRQPRRLSGIHHYPMHFCAGNLCFCISSSTREQG